MWGSAKPSGSGLLLRSGDDPTPFCLQIHRGLETTPTPLPHDRLTFLEMKESMLKSELEQMRAGIKTEGAERKNE